MARLRAVFIEAAPQTPSRTPGVRHVGMGAWSTPGCCSSSGQSSWIRCSRPTLVRVGHGVRRVRIAAGRVTRTRVRMLARKARIAADKPPLPLDTIAAAAVEVSVEVRVRSSDQNLFLILLPFFCGPARIPVPGHPLCMGIAESYRNVPFTRRHCGERHRRGKLVGSDAIHGAWGHYRGRY